MLLAPQLLVGPGGKNWVAELHRLPRAQGTHEVDGVPALPTMTPWTSLGHGLLICQRRKEIELPVFLPTLGRVKSWTWPYYVHIRVPRSLRHVLSNCESRGLAGSPAWGLEGKVPSTGKPCGVPQSRLTWAPTGSM